MHKGWWLQQEICKILKSLKSFQKKLTESPLLPGGPADPGVP